MGLLTEQEMQGPFGVYYKFDKPSLNTRKDPHRISRNALQTSVNMWANPGAVFQKRPGTANYATGSTGSGLAAVGMASCRFTTNVAEGQVTKTYVIVKQGVSMYANASTPANYWGNIDVAGNVAGSYLSKHCGQLFDAQIAAVGVDVVFLCLGAVTNVAPSTTIRRWTGTLTTSNGSITAASPATITPTSMQGIYVGQKIRIPDGVSSETITVITVGTTTFTANVLNNHANGIHLDGQVDSPGTVPTNWTNSAAITPRYSKTLYSHLFYTGEPTAPSAVYVSDPQAPETFSTSFFNTSVYPGSYQPALVGHNDGVNGGNITGLERLGSSMIIFKESAIYRMDQIGLFNQMIWTATLVSSSVGCVASESIQSFDTYIVFLAFDGVYITDGVNQPQKISKNVQTYFEGAGATIVNRTTAVGIRYSHWYLLFFQDNAGANANDRGMWFDFDTPDEDGFPSTGEFTFGANGGVSGVAALVGPSDTTQAILAQNGADKIVTFPSGTSDYAGNITCSFTTKQDCLDDYLGEFGSLMPKEVEYLTITFDSLTGSVNATVNICGQNNAAVATTMPELPGSSTDTPKVYVQQTVGSGVNSPPGYYAIYVAFSETSQNGFDIDGMVFSVTARPASTAR